MRQEKKILNVDELYEYIRQRTGLGRFHPGLEEGKTEFTDKEAEEIAECMEFVCAEHAKHEAKRKLRNEVNMVK